MQGDHNRTIGEIVELKIPSYAYPDEPGHTYYRGNYLITKIKHNVNGDGLFNTEMQLVKDSLFTKLENEDNLDSSGNTPSSEDYEIAKQAEADLIESVGPEQNFGDSSFRIITNKDGSTRVSGRLWWKEFRILYTYRMPKILWVKRVLFGGIKTKYKEIGEIT